MTDQDLKDVGDGRVFGPGRPLGSVLLHVGDVPEHVRVAHGLIEIRIGSEWVAWRGLPKEAAHVMAAYRDSVDAQARMDEHQRNTHRVNRVEWGMTIEEAREVARLVRMALAAGTPGVWVHSWMLEGARAELARVFTSFDWELRGGEIQPFVAGVDGER